MLSTWFLRFYDTKLKRSYARGPLVLIFCLQILLAFAYNEYLILRQVYQRHFELEEWGLNKVTACNGNFVAFGNQFLRLKNAKINLNNLAFVIPCNTEIPRYWFDRRGDGTPYTNWLAGLEVRELGQHEKDQVKQIRISGITYAVRRVEAHNLYHTVCEIYNIFLVHKLLGIEWRNINILFMDSRPPSKMDEIWTRMFDNVIHHEDVEESQTFEHLIWIPIGYESPIHRHYLHSVPFASEFQKVFIESFGVKKTKKIDCTSFNYTLILRHDYITHPERLSLFQGKLQRKLANEKDLIQAIQSAISPRSSLRTVLLETLSMKEQIEVFTYTDVLIAVHGAGMTHILNLPDHAFVLELRPFSLDNSLIENAYHFRAMSRWKGLNYLYVRSDNRIDDIHSYEISISIKDLMRQILVIRCHLDSICGASDTHCPLLEEP